MKKITILMLFTMINSYGLDSKAQTKNKTSEKSIDKSEGSKPNKKKNDSDGRKKRNEVTENKSEKSGSSNKDVSSSSDKNKKTSAISSAERKKIIPPKIIKAVPPVYPSKAYSDTEVWITLKLTVNKDGSVGKIVVEKSGGKLYDQSAIQAALKWKFKPATYKNIPIPVRISVPFKFPPRKRIIKSSSKTGKTDVSEEESEVISAGGSSNKSQTFQKTTNTSASKKPTGIIEHKNEPKKVLVEHLNQSIKVKEKFKIIEKNDKKNSTDPNNIIVTGIRKKPIVAAGEFKISHAILTAAPKKSAGDMLKTAPGFYVGHPQGEGMANALFLRGFNAEHGQDFELWAGEVPINLPGHIHAQGYADMHFLIPEVISSLKVIEGVFNPMQGDFAVAGSGYFKYGIRKRGTTLGLSYGSYNSRRLFFIYAPQGEARDTFFAVSMKTSDGFGDGNRSSQAASSVARYHFMLNPKTDLVLHLGAYGGRSVLPGVLRLDDVESGKIGFYDTYDAPTAQAQSGFFSRFETSAKLTKKLKIKKEKIVASMYFLRTDFRIRQNFTGYLLQFPDQPELAGAGDLHQQLNIDETFGASLIYYSGLRKFMNKPFFYKTGVQLRSDWVSQKEDLIFPAQNMIWRHTIDADMQLLDMGVFADSHFKFHPSFEVKAGLRADSLIYEINDELANRQYNVPVQQNHLLGYKRDAMGLVLGPRTSLSFKPFRLFNNTKESENLSLLASYGEGYRSPQPRSLQDGERAPFTKVRSFEAGLKWYLTSKHKYLLKLTGFYTYLNKDYVFDPLTAMAKEIGDTTRTGGVVFINARPFRGLNISASFTYAYAVLNGPPLATPDNPTPGEKKGDLIPYIPPMVGRIDASYRSVITEIYDKKLTAKAGLGYTYLSPRPLPYGEWADPVNLLDAQISFYYDIAEVKISVSNLLDSKWHDMEYNFVSQWDPNTPTSLPARHFVAGAPRMITAALILHF